jgi:hypothetical protein
MYGTGRYCKCYISHGCQMGGDLRCEHACRLGVVFHSWQSQLQCTMVLSCFGKLCATEASKKPKKRYNEYVPAVFPTEAQGWRSPIIASTARNISTVQDYVGENIQRAPKVSRRLWRRIVKDHSNDAALGQVKVRLDLILRIICPSQSTSLNQKQMQKRCQKRCIESKRDFLHQLCIH